MVGVGIIFILANFLWLYPFVRDVEQGATRYQAEVARRVAGRADFFLEKKLREMGELALDVLEANADSRKMPVIAAKFLGRHPDFIAIDFVPVGVSSAVYSVGPVTQANGRKTIVITAPLPYASLAVKATVTIGDVVGGIARERVGSFGRVYVIDRAGNVVFHQYEGIVNGSVAIARPFMSVEGGAGTYRNEAGTDVTGVAIFASGVGWTVVAEDPLSEAWARKYQAIRLAIFLMILGFILLMLLAWSTKKVMGIAERERLLSAAKSEYVSLLAHQLRTPLAGTKWNLKTLADGDWGPLNAKQKKFLERSYETNEQMIALVRDLLDITRIEEGRYGFELKKEDVGTFLAKVVNEFRDQAKVAGISLVLKKPRGRVKVPQIALDAEKMAMAVGNLIDNAIRYNKPKGSVEVGFAREGSNVAITVADTGVGVPKGQVGQLFGKFFRGENVVKMQVQGFGLGLFIVKNIIEKHGGAIAVESKENEGTTFTITLPAR